MLASASPRVPLRELEHLVGHVEAVHGSARADSPRGEEDVDPAAGAQVEHRFALVQIRDGDRVSAAEARRDRVLGESRALVPRLEPLSEDAPSPSSPQQPMLSRHPLSRSRFRWRAHVRHRRTARALPRASRLAVVVMPGLLSGRGRSPRARGPRGRGCSRPTTPRCSRWSNPALWELLQVMAHCWLREPDGRRDLTHARGLAGAGEEVDDAHARGIAERLEESGCRLGVCRRHAVVVQRATAVCSDDREGIDVHRWRSLAHTSMNVNNI